jgi:hypothetical protein
MPNSSLYAQIDPTGVSGYQTTLEGNGSYAVTFQVNEAGTLKEIWYYSPAMAGTGTILPDYVGLFVADNLTPLMTKTSLTWSGAESSGWIKTTVPDTAVTPGNTYFACIANTTPSSPFKQAYLYAGSTELIPQTSADGHITTPATTSGLTHGPNGATQPYHNGAGLSYPDTQAPQQLNWLIDVGIQFTAPVPPHIDTTTLPNASRLYPYSTTLSASSGSAPFTWSVASGSLPPGLSLNSSTGVISGTPTSNGLSTFVIEVTDSNSLTDTAGLTISVQTILVGSPVTVSGISTYAVTAGINTATGSVSAAPHNVRVLQPVSPAAGRPHAFLWMLPVEPDQGTSFGDSIGYAKTLGLNDTYNLTCIQPGYPVDPWYINSDTDPTSQGDTYLMALFDWAEGAFGAGKHYLIGFSKSGFGGQEIFWHHQDRVEKVASWDAAMDYQTLSDYDGAASLGSQTNLTNNKLYNPNLTTWKALGNTGTVKRIFLYAGINLVTPTADYHARLNADGILNDYTFASTGAHNWVTSPPWVPGAVAAMLGSVKPKNAGMSAAFI